LARGEGAREIIFYRLCPTPLVTPLVILATFATIIASQSIITGAFSMTRQAIQLGWLPRLTIKQTSAEGYGQIYVGAVNWLLMIVTVALALGFRRSDNLAAAYGIAVLLTMLITSVLLFIAMREVWRWNLIAAGAAAAGFLLVDGAFFAANLSKIVEGGYVPLLLALAVYGVMLVWHRGAMSVRGRIEASLTPIEAFIAELQSCNIARAPGTAAFLTRSKHGVPPVMDWHVRQNRSLHNFVLILTLTVASTPRVERQERLTLAREAQRLWRAELRYGFMEHPDVPAALAECRSRGREVDLDDVTYYVGGETILSRDDRLGIPRWEEALFAAMARNAAAISDYLKLPNEHVVEIGRRISI
jgi:KUP system potassium uptake protein